MHFIIQCTWKYQTLKQKRYFPGPVDKQQSEEQSETWQYIWVVCLKRSDLDGG